MRQLENILVATDLSSPARQAAHRAAQLVSSPSARLRLLHVLNAGMAAQLQQLLGLGSALEATLVGQTRADLQAEVDDLAVGHLGVREAALAHGNVVDEIARQADTMPADLVVLGARGTGFLRRMMLGSTAERLLRKSTRPMLVVKQRAHEPYARALLALDFSPWSAPLIRLAQRVAPGAHLVLLSAYDVPFEGKLRYAGVGDTDIHSYRARARQAAEQQLHALAAQAGLAPADWTPCLPFSEASLAIVEYEQVMGCDLIVVGKHGRHMVEELLLGSVTSHVLAESTGDVLVSTLADGIGQGRGG